MFGKERTHFIRFLNLITICFLSLFLLHLLLSKTMTTCILLSYRKRFFRQRENLVYVPTFVIVVEVVTADTLEYVSRMTIASEKVVCKEKNLHFYCKVTGNDDCDVALAPYHHHCTNMKQYSFARQQ